MSTFRYAFTLVELLVVVGIGSLVLLVTAGILRDVFFLNESDRQAVNVEYSLRATKNLFIADVRRAERSDQGSFPVYQATANEVVLHVNTEVSDHVDRVVYQVIGNTLYRRVFVPTGSPLVYPDITTESASSQKIVAENIVNPDTIFSYFTSGDPVHDDALTLPATLAAIRFIQLELVVDENPDRPPAPVTIKTGAAIRNLKDYLDSE